jgi:HD-GYP domain-containing protein (c-di-GMP phosphodiesterase class II)
VTKARGAELLDALERHRPGARDHAHATASHAFAIAVELGLERQHAEATREAARLQEVGQIYVPTAVLAKPPGERTPEDEALIDSHPGRGAELARGAGVPDDACEWILATRERFDGHGPAGLAGERIPIESRIIRVACAHYASLAMQPAPDSPHPRGGAFAEVRKASGRELDPRVVEALAAILERAGAAEQV